MSGPSSFQKNPKEGEVGNGVDIKKEVFSGGGRMPCGSFGDVPACVAQLDVDGGDRGLCDTCPYYLDALRKQEKESVLVGLSTGGVRDEFWLDIM